MPTLSGNRVKLFFLAVALAVSFVAVLSTGDTAMIIFHFHLAEGYQLLQHPRGDESRPKRGVFALRSPFRPNAIGITEVEILDIRENVLTVRGLDAINGTPVLDMKPV